MNSEFFFSETSCLTKAEEISLPYYLPIAGGRIIGFIPFPRVLVLCEMQSASSRIRTRIAVSISYGDNHYITGWLFGKNQSINQLHTHTHTYIYIIEASFIQYDGTLDYCWLLIFLCRDPGGKGIVPYLQPKRFRSYFWLSSLQILEAICIKKQQANINCITFNTGAHILNIFLLLKY